MVGIAIKLCQWIKIYQMENLHNLLLQTSHPIDKLLQKYVWQDKNSSSNRSHRYLINFLLSETTYVAWLPLSLVFFWKHMDWHRRNLTKSWPSCSNAAQKHVYADTYWYSVCVLTLNIIWNSSIPSTFITGMNSINRAITFIWELYTLKSLIISLALVISQWWGFWNIVILLLDCPWM